MELARNAMKALSPEKPSYDEVVSRVMDFARKEEMSDAEASRFLKSQLKKFGYEVREQKAKAKGGKIKGYAYGTSKGGVKKMSSCRGRKAMGNKD
jgi:hypothetical protein